MSFVRGLIKVAKGAAVGVAAVTALPIFGAVGTITSAGIIIGAAVGAVAGVADEVIESKKNRPKPATREDTGTT
jgi:hypothetical protein